MWKRHKEPWAKGKSASSGVILASTVPDAFGDFKDRGLENQKTAEYWGFFNHRSLCKRRRPDLKQLLGRRLGPFGQGAARLPRKAPKFLLLLLLLLLSEFESGLGPCAFDFDTD